jgi:hypothetical protein
MMMKKSGTRPDPVLSLLRPVIWENSILPADAMEKKIESRRLTWSHPDLDLPEMRKVYSEDAPDKFRRNVRI